MIQSKVKMLSSGQQFLHYNSVGKIFVAQGRVTPKYGPIWSKIKIWDFTDVLAAGKYGEDPIKMKSQSIGDFPHYKAVGANCSSLKGKE